MNQYLITVSHGGHTYIARVTKASSEENLEDVKKFVRSRALALALELTERRACRAHRRGAWPRIRIWKSVEETFDTRKMWLDKEAQK